MTSLAVVPAMPGPGAAFVGAHLAELFARAGGRIVCLDLDPQGQAWRRLLPADGRVPGGLAGVLTAGRPLGPCLVTVRLHEVVEGYGLRRTRAAVRVGGWPTRFGLPSGASGRLRPGALAGALAGLRGSWRVHAAFVVAPALPDLLAEHAVADADRVLVVVPHSDDTLPVLRTTARKIAGLRPRGATGVRYVLTGVGDPAAATACQEAMGAWLDPAGGGPGGRVTAAWVRQALYQPLPAAPDSRTAEDLGEVACELELAWGLLGWRRRRLGAGRDGGHSPAGAASPAGAG